MRLFVSSPFSTSPGQGVLRRGLWPCLLGCVLLAGCSGMDEAGNTPHRLPKADMTEAYPKKPFRELHHPLPPYWGGMVPMVQVIQPTPDEQTGRSVHTSESDQPHFPPQTQTEASYGPPPSRQKPQ